MQKIFNYYFLNKPKCIIIIKAGLGIGFFTVLASIIPILNYLNINIPNLLTTPSLNGTTWEYNDGKTRLTLSYKKNNEVEFKVFNDDGSLNKKINGTYILNGDTLTELYKQEGKSDYEEVYTYVKESITSKRNPSVVFKPQQK